jgi:hypothetical protein
MSRLPVSGVLLVALGLTAAACDGGPMSTKAQSLGYFNSAGAPLVAPTDQNATSDSTTKKQEESDYFPGADALLVSPYQGNGDAGSTLKNQKKSGYFPDAGSPLVPRNTSGVQ